MNLAITTLYKRLLLGVLGSSVHLADIFQTSHFDTIVKGKLFVAVQSAKGQRISPWNI